MDSAGASLNEAPRTTAIGPQFSSYFLIATFLNNDRLLLVTVHEVQPYMGRLRSHF